MVPWLNDDPRSPFPPVASALARPNGLLAAGGDLTVPRLLRAYAEGIFPWYSTGEPILWWSPDPRCVLFTNEVHVSRRLARRMRQGAFELGFNKDFDGVIRACAAPRKRQNETWITPEMREAYMRLHREGHAHSLEIRHGGKLTGGLYGVAIGRVFFAESMFSLETDASKIVLVTLCRRLARWGFPLIDCQVDNPHLRRMGARLISRAGFMKWLAYTREAGPAEWSL